MFGNFCHFLYKSTVDKVFPAGMISAILLFKVLCFPNNLRFYLTDIVCFLNLEWFTTLDLECNKFWDFFIILLLPLSSMIVILGFKLSSKSLSYYELSSTSVSFPVNSISLENLTMLGLSILLF